MKRVKVDLFGKRGQRTTEVTSQGFPTRHVSTGNPEPQPLQITPNPLTPAEQVKAVIPAYKEAWKNNRPRLISYLTAGFHGNLSEGVTLHALGTALETTYAPRKAMTAAQWHSWINDLQTENYDSIQWLANLQTRIYRKYEDLRPPRPLVEIETEGKIPVFLCDAEDGDLLIYAYEELPDNYEYVWRRYCRRYNCTVRIETPTETFTISNEPEQSEQTEVA